MSQELNKLSLQDLYDLLLEKTLELLEVIKSKVDRRVLKQKSEEVREIQDMIRIKKGSRI
jgi:hypothetical protein